MDYPTLIVFLISVLGQGFLEVAALIAGLFMVAIPFSMLIQFFNRIDEE